MATRASSMRWGRLLLAVVVVTGLVAVILSLVVAVYGAILGAQAQGTPDQAQLQRFADRVGAWLGTVLAVVLTAGAARWVARGMEPRAATGHGVLVGLAVAIIGLLFGGSFGIAALVGFVLTVAAGWLGGKLGGRGG